MSAQRFIPGALTVAAALIALSTYVPWGLWDCDDGCGDGRTGAVSGHMPADFVAAARVTAALLLLLSVAAALVTTARARRMLGALSLLLGLIAVVAIDNVSDLGGYGGAPFLRPQLGWWLDLAGTVMVVGAGVALRPARILGEARRRADLAA